MQSLGRNMHVSGLLKVTLGALVLFLLLLLTHGADNHPPPEFVKPPVALPTLPGLLPSLLTTVLMDEISWRSCTT